jgi:two-component system nitrate/nitrite sensor histidine kinase NarX
MGQLVGVEGIARNITDCVHAYQMLEQRVEERMRELERRHQVAQGLHDILTILNSNRTLNEILEYIIGEACQLLGTSVGAIYRLNRQEAVLNIRASRGLDSGDAGLNLPVEWGAVSRAAVQRQPAVVPDSTTLVPDHRDRRTSMQPQSHQKRLSDHYRALLAVPLIIKDEVYGAIALYYPEPRAFSDEEMRLATAISDQAALAIENALLVAAAQNQAVLEERQRLARDLHDSVTQSLYGITLHAEAATRLLASDDVATAVDYLRELQETAQEALEEMRLLIFELRPAILEQAGLVAALQARLDTVEGHAKLTSTFTVEDVGRLPARIEQELYRIAQEALNNVLKHAHPQCVSVTLRQAQSTLILEITDDGVGFDPAMARERGGLGLSGIEERVLLLGGRLTLQSAPGAGTRVRMELEL